MLWKTYIPAEDRLLNALRRTAQTYLRPRS
jgi:hypothetical protein